MYTHACVCTHTHTHIKRIIEKFKTHENKGRKLPNPHTKKCKHGDLLQVLIIIGRVIKAKKETGFIEKQITCLDEICFFSSNEK